MQNERAEHLKEIDSLKGQNAPNNHAIADYQARVNDQQNQMADLRKRQGFKPLQDDRNAALEDVEAERQKCRALHEQLTEAQNDIERLQQDVRASGAALDAAEIEAADARSATEVEREWREKLESVIEGMQKEMEQLQSDKSSVEAVLLSIQEAARGNASGTSHGRTSPNGATEQGYFTNFGHNIDGGAGSHVLTGEDVQRPREGVLGDSSPSGLGRSQPASPAARPRPAARSPSSQTDGGFRTVHGIHRPDGSLGGYRAGKGMRRGTGGVISRMNSPGNAYEGRSMSTDSLGSQARSQDGSLETIKEEVNGNGIANPS